MDSFFPAIISPAVLVGVLIRKLSRAKLSEPLEQLHKALGNFQMSSLVQWRLVLNPFCSFSRIAMSVQGSADLMLAMKDETALDREMDLGVSNREPRFVENLDM